MTQLFTAQGDARHTKRVERSRPQIQPLDLPVRTAGRAIAPLPEPDAQTKQRIREQAMSRAWVSEHYAGANAVYLMMALLRERPDLHLGLITMSHDHKNRLIDAYVESITDLSMVFTARGWIKRKTLLEQASQGAPAGARPSTRSDKHRRRIADLQHSGAYNFEDPYEQQLAQHAVRTFLLEEIREFAPLRPATYPSFGAEI